MKNKSFLFVTGTRADFGKLRPIAETALKVLNNRVWLFTTGMHLSPLYGETWHEVADSESGEVVPFNNSIFGPSMEMTLAQTIIGLSNFLDSERVDYVVVHGDRVEAMAGALVAGLRDIPLIHIEGGESSGTVDEMIRHSISKLATYHLVSNVEAQTKLLALGEKIERIRVIGSPEVDVIASKAFPSLEEVKRYYNFDFADYSIAIFHPVVTELNYIDAQSEAFFHALIESDRNYLLISPNNDSGSEVILSKLQKTVDLHSNRFRHIPSMRFPYYLSALQSADFIIGNSSSGVREAPNFGVPCINIGSRQTGRASSNLIVNCNPSLASIMRAIEGVLKIDRKPEVKFGEGNSRLKFAEAFNEGWFDSQPTQK